LGADEEDTVGTTGESLVIEPKGGTMVVFDSRTVLHQMLPANERRIALTIWIEGDVESGGGEK